jgi:hypothetical protein
VCRQNVCAPLLITYAASEWALVIPFAARSEMMCNNNGSVCRENLKKRAFRNTWRGGRTMGPIVGLLWPPWAGSATTKTHRIICALFVVMRTCNETDPFAALFQIYFSLLCCVQAFKSNDHECILLVA